MLFFNLRGNTRRSGISEFEVNRLPPSRDSQSNRQTNIAKSTLILPKSTLPQTYVEAPVAPSRSSKCYIPSFLRRRYSNYNSLFLSHQTKLLFTLTFGDINDMDLVLKFINLI